LTRTVEELSQGVIEPDAWYRLSELAAFSCCSRGFVLKQIGTAINNDDGVRRVRRVGTQYRVLGAAWLDFLAQSAENVSRGHELDDSA
jgi:hypothetical protein